MSDGRPAEVVCRFDDIERVARFCKHIRMHAALCNLAEIRDVHLIKINLLKISDFKIQLFPLMFKILFSHVAVPKNVLVMVFDQP